MLYNILGQKGKIVLKYLGEKRRGQKAKDHFWANGVLPEKGIYLFQNLVEK